MPQDKCIVEISTTRTAVIVVNYHGTELTTKCVASLLKSIVPLSVVVVDNTPDDPNLELALTPFPGVSLLRAPENLGFGRGNNLGIDWALAHTDCEFMLLLNNDAFIQEDTVLHLEKALDEHPEAGIVSPRIVLFESPALLWYGGGEVDWKRGSGRVPGVLGPADAEPAIMPRYITFASGCAMLIRKTLLIQEKGFDQRFFMYEEDLELSLRVQEKGWHIWYEPQALVLHIGQGSQKNSSDFKGVFDARNPNLVFFVYHIVKNRLLNMWLHASGKNKLIFLCIFPFFLASKCFQWGVHNRIDALRSVAKALIDYRKEKIRLKP